MVPTFYRLKAVPVLIAVNVLVYVYQVTLASPRFLGIFALSAPGLEAGGWWQFFTHAFLHGNTLHLLFNMMGLWFAGRIVERVMGTWRFLALYVIAAVAGGVFQMALGANTMLLGASGAVFGVIVAFTTIFPESQVVALLFFIPVRLRAKYLGRGLAGSSLFFLATGLMPFIGHAAHLGGCVAGYLFARFTARHVPGSRPPPDRGLTSPVVGRYSPDADHRNFHRNPG